MVSEEDNLLSHGSRLNIMLLRPIGYLYHAEYLPTSLWSFLDAALVRKGLNLEI